jgi:transposase
MESCPNCNSSDFRKDGIVKQKQRYLCKSCKYRFTVANIGKPDDVKRDALILYLEGLGFRSIGRVLKVSHVSVFNWIKSFGEKLDSLRSSDEIEVVEIDEMHTYIGSKKTTVGSGLLLIDMGNDSSIAKLALGEQRQEKSFGRRSKRK